jgi:hypothetical protein
MSMAHVSTRSAKMLKYKQHIVRNEIREAESENETHFAADLERKAWEIIFLQNLPEMQVIEFLSISFRQKRPLHIDRENS